MSLFSPSHVRERMYARIESNWETPKSYKRIRIIGLEDIELTYPLIAAYVENPDLALSVEHLVLDETSWPNDRAGYRWPRKPQSARPVREDAHKAIEDYVGTLGFGEATTQRMLRALSWKKQYLKFERTEDTDASFYARNAEYGHVAVTVLLSLCKNITLLHLGSYISFSPLKEYMMKSNYGLIPQPALQRLKTVEYHAGDWSSGHSTAYIPLEFLDWFRYFHLLPGVQSVTMEGVAQDQNFRNLFPPGVSNVRRLHLGHSHVYSSMLGTIIRMHKGLEELSISLGGMSMLGGFTQVVYPKTIGKSLLTQKDTLRILDLDMDIAHRAHVNYDGTITEIEDDKEKEHFEDYGGEEEALEEEYDKWFDLDERDGDGGPLWVEELPNTRPYQLTIGSLHDFTALKRLSIGIMFLMGPNAREYQGPNSWTEPSGPPFRLATSPPFRLVDALPPNLEYLCLRGFYKGENPDVDDHIDELLDKCADRFPYLKEIEGIDIPVPGLGVEFGQIRSRIAGSTEEHPGTEQRMEYVRHPKLDLDWIEA